MRFHKEEELVEDVILHPSPTSAYDQQEEIETHHPPLMTRDDQEPEDDEEEEEEDSDDQEVNRVEEEDGGDQEGNANHDEEGDEEDEDNEEEVASEEEEEDDDDGDNKEEEEEEEAEVCSTDVPTTTPLYLVYHHGRRECKQSFFSISEGIHFVRSVPEMNGMTCCACCEGWLVMVNNYSRRCFLFNPVTMENIELPHMNRRFVYCVLSSSPPDCVVMFVFEYASCIFCRPNDQKWTRKILGPKWKEGSANRHCFKVIYGAVSCKGKIYLNFMHGGGIKVLDTATEYNATRINNHSLTVVEKIKFEENLPMDFLDFFCCSARINSYMVESCGEIFMAIKIYRVFDQDLRNLNVYTFNVFRLNSSLSSTPTGTAPTYCWEKVESLGDDRVFFLAETCSVSTSASKLQVKENYIYYCEPDDEYLYAFNMENSRFSRILPCPHLVRRSINEPCWMLLPII